MIGNEKPAVYFELSDVIDTRLNLMMNAFPLLAEEMVENNLWMNRSKEGYSYVSTKLFEHMYKNRDKTTLARPMPTSITMVIQETVVRMSHEYEANGIKTTVKLFLNVYPYELSSVEIDYIVRSIEHNMIVPVEIEIVNIKKITPSWVLNNVNVIVMYNGTEWISELKTYKNINSLTMPEILMITPAKANHIKGLPYSSETFQDISKDLAPIIRVEFSDFGLFSTSKKIT